MMKKLNRQTSVHTYTAPERILQFGGGNFLRGFVDWMIDILNKQTDFKGSVIVVKPTERGDYTELKEQDGLFHVALDGIDNGDLVSKIDLVESVSRTIQPYTQWEEYLATAENPDMRFVISNTTEAGIRFSINDAIEHCPPHEFPAKLTSWLYHRFKHFKGDPEKGCIMLPCELIEQNGEALKIAVVQYATEWKLGAEFNEWIGRHNYFCNTLVDRIVSGYPKGRAEEIRNKIGYEDQLLVAGEYYHSWIIEGPDNVSQELPFAETNLNVQFVDDLTPYREMKVRILNGAHTSLVPVGYLSGARTVIEAMNDKLLSTFVERVLFEEVMRTITDVPEAEIKAFANSVIARFKNPTLQHKLISIALNSTSKFTARLYPVLQDYTETKRNLPKHIVFALSCLILFYRGEYEKESIDVQDDSETIATFQKVWADYGRDKNYLELSKTILSDIGIWDVSLSTIPGLVDAVTDNLKRIDETSVRIQLEKMIKKS